MKKECSLNRIAHSVTDFDHFVFINNFVDFNIDFRPNSSKKGSHNVKSMCAVNILFYENGLPKYQCLQQQANTDGNIFNKALNITSTIINITAALQEDIPEMLWFSVIGEFNSLLEDIPRFEIFFISH